VVQVVHSTAVGQQGQRDRRISLSYVPIATTCAMYEERLIIDPDAEEEALAASSITSVVDGAGRLIGMLCPHHGQLSQSLS